MPDIKIENLVHIYYMQENFLTCSWFIPHVRVTYLTVTYLCPHPCPVSVHTFGMSVTTILLSYCEVAGLSHSHS